MKYHNLKTNLNKNYIIYLEINFLKKPKYI